MSARTSAGPSPRSTSTASSSSLPLPTARPSGASIEVSQATAGQPRSRARSTSVRASRSASSRRRMNAPEPTFTSSTSPSRSSASFLLRMLAAMSGMESTVAVTSRSAYSRRSAGASSSVCPSMHTPSSPRTRSASASDRSVRNPGMAASLSSVPPVWPSPRPLTIGTARPQAATSGARQRETLSPTPPVECLSTRGGEPGRRRSVLPEWSMASVQVRSSAASRPRKKTAMHRAAIW